MIISIDHGNKSVRFPLGAPFTQACCRAMFCPLVRICSKTEGGIIRLPTNASRNVRTRRRISVFSSLPCLPSPGGLSPPDGIQRTPSGCRLRWVCRRPTSAHSTSPSLDIFWAGVPYPSFTRNGPTPALLMM